MCWKNSKFDPITGSPKCSQFILRGIWTTWNKFQPVVVEMFLLKSTNVDLTVLEEKLWDRQRYQDAPSGNWSQNNLLVQRQLTDILIFNQSFEYLLSKIVKHVLHFEDTLLLFVIHDNKPKSLWVSGLRLDDRSNLRMWFGVLGNGDELWWVTNYKTLRYWHLHKSQEVNQSWEDSSSGDRECLKDRDYWLFSLQMNLLINREQSCNQWHISSFLVSLVFIFSVYPSFNTPTFPLEQP